MAPHVHFRHLIRSSRQDLTQFKPIQPSESDPSPIAPAAARTHSRSHTSPARLDKFYREDSYIDPANGPAPSTESEKDSETVTKNPVFLNPLISPSVVRVKYTQSSDVPKVEEDIFKCFIAYTGNQERKVAVLTEIQSLFEPVGKMNEFLKLMLLRAPYASLIKAYFAKAQKDIDQFAAVVIPQLLNTEKGLTLIHLCGLYTLSDLEGEKPSTLFRGTCFSSTLCKEVGRGFWARELAELNGIILPELRKNEMWQNNPFLLCLDRNRAKIILEEQMKRISVGNQDRYVETMLMDHAHHFLKFARGVLPSIFSMKMPDLLSTLVKERRAHIRDFLKNNSSKDPIEESRPYIGELVCNRILCPYIISLDPTPEVLCVMKSLTKFIQNCASGVPFGGDKKDPVYEILNPLFDEFGPMYRNFIDTHSL
jgi:hypothetical protein